MGHVDGSIVGLQLWTFKGNVRLCVQQNSHLSNPRSYRMSMPVGLLATAAAADFQHRCVALRC